MLSRAGSYVAGIGTYVRIAWWGLVSPATEPGGLVVVQAVVQDGDQVLLAVRNDIRGWELPGGQVDEAESLEQALVREIGEETGLLVAVDRHVGAYRRTGFRPHVAHVFVCHRVGGELRTSRESRALSWFHPLLLPDTLFPWYQQPLRDAFVPDAEPVERQERQGLAAIWAAMKIDIRMRWQGDRPKKSAPTANGEGALCEVRSPSRQRTRGSDSRSD
ncbi:MAG: NUDIX hydrolase [Myxococcota bacterium]|nr:NUDIX hydrolase [Myxococcota bacterium]